MAIWYLPINLIISLTKSSYSPVGSKSLSTLDALLYGKVFSKIIHQKRWSCSIFGSLQSHITELSLNHTPWTVENCLEEILAWK